jgi:hypothetical protein
LANDCFFPGTAIPAWQTDHPDGERLCFIGQQRKGFPLNIMPVTRHSQIAEVVKKPDELLVGVFDGHMTEFSPTPIGLQGSFWDKPGTRGDRWRMHYVPACDEGSRIYARTDRRLVGALGLEIIYRQRHLAAGIPQGRIGAEFLITEANSMDSQEDVHVSVDPANHFPQGPHELMQADDLLDADSLPRLPYHTFAELQPTSSRQLGSGGILVLAGVVTELLDNYDYYKHLTSDGVIWE